MTRFIALFLMNIGVFFTIPNFDINPEKNTALNTNQTTQPTDTTSNEGGGGTWEDE